MKLGLAKPSGADTRQEANLLFSGDFASSVGPDEVRLRERGSSSGYRDNSKVIGLPPLDVHMTGAPPAIPSLYWQCHTCHESNRQLRLVCNGCLSLKDTDLLHGGFLRPMEIHRNFCFDLRVRVEEDLRGDFDEYTLHPSSFKQLEFLATFALSAVSKSLSLCHHTLSLGYQRFPIKKHTHLEPQGPNLPKKLVNVIHLLGASVQFGILDIHISSKLIPCAYSSGGLLRLSRIEHRELVIELVRVLVIQWRSFHQTGRSMPF